MLVKEISIKIPVPLLIPTLILNTFLIHIPISVLIPAPNPIPMPNSIPIRFLIMILSQIRKQIQLNNKGITPNEIKYIELLAPNYLVDYKSI